MKKRGVRKTRIGVVVSDKMQGSCVIKVIRRVKDPLYEKYVTSSKKYMVDDRENKSRIGDTIRIMETRPISKNKRWRLVEVLKKAETA